MDPEDKNLESKLPEGVTTYRSTGAFFLFVVVGGASSRAVFLSAAVLCAHLRESRGTQARSFARDA